MIATLQSTPKNATHWSRAKMAERSGLPKSTVGRIWKTSELRPHRTDRSILSDDPLFRHGTTTLSASSTSPTGE